MTLTDPQQETPQETTSSSSQAGTTTDSPTVTASLEPNLPRPRVTPWKEQRCPAPVVMIQHLQLTQVERARRTFAVHAQVSDVVNVMCTMPDRG